VIGERSRLAPPKPLILLCGLDRLGSACFCGNKVDEPERGALKNRRGLERGLRVLACTEEPPLGPVTLSPETEAALVELLHIRFTVLAAARAHHDEVQTSFLSGNIKCVALGILSYLRHL
jgi:hypothetical protein